MNNHDYFIAIYTNKVKDYCDKVFFETVYNLSKGNPVRIVDNTIDGGEYCNKIKDLCKSYDNFQIHHIDVPKQPSRTQFLRNVEQSVNYLRDIFLKTNINNFLIIESDVLPPIDLIEKFSNNKPENFGILGALYYQGFHDYNKTGLQKTNHVLSGCTIYTRKLIEKYKFRWDNSNLGAFPDAWICFDSGNEFNLYNNHDIKCQHLHNTNGTRYSSSL